MQNKIKIFLQKKCFTKKLLFLVLPVVFLAFYPDSVHAASLYEWVSNPVGQAFKGFLYAIFVFVGWFTSVAVTLFSYVVDPANISGPTGLLNLQAVYDMWKFVRDFINIFFILGLLFIAFAFVFQIDSYSNSKAIIKLVIAALLVNFSFPIARVIIDFANVPMYFFLQMIVGSGDNASGVLSSALGASGLQSLLLPETDSSDVSTLLAGIIFLFIFNITIFVFAFQFLIRLIALVILVILSPIGFVASGIPGLKKYGSQWWDNFLKYCFFGPAAVFMLVLATNFFAAISSGDQKNTMGALASETSADPGFISSMALFFIPIVMLWFAMGISDKFAIAGASIATKYGKDFAKFIGKKATVAPAKFVGRKIDSKLASTKYGKYISPSAVKAAFKQRSEEQKHQDEQPIKLAAATMQDQLNNVLSRTTNSLAVVGTLGLNKNLRARFGENTDHTDHRFEERRKQQSGYVKELTDVSDRSDIIIGHMRNAVKSGNAAEVEAALSVLTKNNDLNDLVMAVGEEFGGSKEVSSKNVKKVLTNILKEVGVTDEQDIGKTLTVLSDQAMASGNFAFGGMSHIDSSHGHPEFSVAKDVQQGQSALDKFKNLEAQKQAQILHPDTLFKRDATGFTDMNDEVAAEVIKGISAATADQSNRSRSDMQGAIADVFAKYQANPSSVPQFKANYEANENFRYYVQQMLEAKNKGKNASQTPKVKVEVSSETP